MTGSFKTQLINMGTRSAAFQAKLRCLHEFHIRLLNPVGPPPSGIDIANNIKYFSLTLLGVLKEIPNSPHQTIKDPSQDLTRMSGFPNLEYGNLYNVLAMLLDVAPNLQVGLVCFGKAVLHCLCCIMPFLDKDLIDNIPYLTASCISVLPATLHQDIINALCFYIMPFTITRQSAFQEQECHSCQSVSAVIMLVFQYSDNPAHHCQLLECLMTLKHNVVKDLLCVIAYGTAASRSSAAKLLFYYWPAFNANLFDRRGLLCKFTNDLIPFVCQREACPNAGNAEATKVCYHHGISIAHAPDCPPPLYLCIECANEVHRDHPDQTFGDLLHPMAQVSMICENKNCRSNEKSAISICFSTECAGYNGMHPIRYCSQCHSNRHNNRRGGDHIVHRSLQPTWQMDAEMQTYMVEAIISLLREAKPLTFEPAKEVSDIRNYPYNVRQDNISLDERQLLGRYGIWLLVGRCTPTSDTPVEILGRLISMLFHWFHVTACSYDGSSTIESAVEKLKSEHVCDWLKAIAKSHYKEFISCLLPHPPEYARVGGHWDTLASRTSHLKEGLHRLICLVPYEIITAQIWDIVMPHWMEAITNDVPEKELDELKIVLSKMLDREMSPLGFEPKAMYHFVAIRFSHTTSKVQQQALHWLQILSKLEILIPLEQLFAMFGDGVRIMKHDVEKEAAAAVKDKNGARDGKLSVKEKDQPRRSSISPVVEDESGNTSAMSDDEAPASRHTDFSSDSEHNLTCCVLMLDILLKQLELQDVEKHTGINTDVCDNVCRLLKCMVTAARLGATKHICSVKSTECASCEASIMWHQLSTKIVQYMAPENPVRPPDVPVIEVIEDEKAVRKSPPESDRNKERYRDVSLSMAPLPIPLGPLGFGGPVPVAATSNPVHMPNICSTSDRHETDYAQFIHATDEIMTATVETMAEQLDVATMIPTENVMTALARSITVSDSDVATATVQVTQPQLLGATTCYDTMGTDSRGFASNNDAGQSGASATNNGTAMGGGGGSTGADDGGDSADDNNEDRPQQQFWHTSVGKFKNNLESLPQTLQYIYQLLTELPTIEKPDILYYILQCLHTLALHGDVLTLAANQHRGFFLWCQENLLIQNLWELCNAEHSHIAEASVPLLLHCITLPLGSDVFWRIVQEAFHDSDWRVRFIAVERVTVITRFMDSTPLRSEVGLQTALATAFCHLIASMDDISVYVAQRATLYLGTIHDKAITSLLFCLESQFDLFIVDRPVVLQSLYQLHNSLSDRKVLSWDFFLNRFDTLFVEAQVNLEKSGDLACLRDLRNSDNGSEVLFTKISKAREALSQSDTFGSGGMAKTLSASFGPKWPYKRTMSAPASIIPRQESKVVYPPEKEKIYNRQTSAPILKRKSSRFGLGQFLSNASIITNPSCSIGVVGVPLLQPQHQHQNTIAAVTPTGHNHQPHNHNYSIQSHLLPSLNCAPHGVQQLLAGHHHHQQAAASSMASPRQHQSKHGAAATVASATAALLSNASASATAGVGGGGAGATGAGGCGAGGGGGGGGGVQVVVGGVVGSGIYAAGRPLGTPNMLTAQQFQHLNEQYMHHGHLLGDHHGLAASGGAGGGVANMATMFNVGAPDGNIYNVGVGGADEQNLTGCLHRIIDLEESDKETIHLLVFLFMQFLSRSDLAFPGEEKTLVKIQTIVLSHLYLLLGYSHIEKNFHVSSNQLRRSAVFNVFLSNLQQVLDQNHHMGWCMLPTVFQVLLYAPSITAISANGSEFTQNIPFTFSLWQLDAHPRRNWLMSVLVIMYKYQYTQPPYSGHINNIIRVILNSLEAHFHQCKRLPSTVITDLIPPSRSRDVSQPSLGGTDRCDDPEGLYSPPPSPMYGSISGAAGADGGNTSTLNGGSGRSKHAAFAAKAGGRDATTLATTSARKYPDSSLDADETESELVAIPESDLSDSTMNRSSAPESFDDSSNFEDMTTSITHPDYYTASATPQAGQHNSGNLAQLALSTLGVMDSVDDVGRSHGDMILPMKISTPDSAKSMSKCSLQEGVRMMVSPAFFVKPTTTGTDAAAAAGGASTSGPSSLSGPAGGKSSSGKKLMRSIEQYDSLDSPMSKMNVLSNPAMCSSSPLSNLSPTAVVGPLEFPTPERLLPIGPPPASIGGVQHKDSSSSSSGNIASAGQHSDTTTVSALVEKVREALALPDLQAAHSPQQQQPHSSAGQNSSRPQQSPSPRRLRKQVALDSPPNSHQLLDANSTVCRSVTHEFKPDPSKASTALKEDTYVAANANANAAGAACTASQPRQRLRKVGPFAVDSQSIPDSRIKYAGSWAPQHNVYDDSSDDGADELHDASENVSGTTGANGGGGGGGADGGANLTAETGDDSYAYGRQATTTRTEETSSKREELPFAEELLCDRCAECGVRSEEYNDEEIGLMVISLATFIHREPSLAAPFLPEILSTVSKFAMHCTFSWQFANATHLPGGSQSVAHQFIRCVLHQLAPNGVFVQMFLTQGDDKQRMKYFKSVAKALIDFPELNPASPVHMLVDTLNQKKTLPLETLNTTLRNMGEYLQCVPLDVGIGTNSWSLVVQGIEALFRRLVLHLKDLKELDIMATGLLDIMVCVLKVPGVSKGVLEPFSKVLSYCVQSSKLKHKVLVDLCALSARVFSKERDKHQLCRQLVFELIQALKFKTTIPNHNVLLLAVIVLQDAGGHLPAGMPTGIDTTDSCTPTLHTSNASDCMRQYIGDILEFVGDIHCLSRIKVQQKKDAAKPGFEEDTLGAQLKGAIAQYLALEMTRGNSKDPKSVARYLPWLYNVPSSLQQQGFKEYTECVGHMRLLSWLLLGTLTHAALVTHRGDRIGQRGVATNYNKAHSHGHSVAQPIPQETSCHIAEHIQVIFTGFADQWKSSVQLMSSLFNAFTLCLLWTVYLEQLALTTPATSEQHNVTMGILFEFWAKITPSILQLAAFSQSFGEMVNLHFISLLEDLKETRSTVLVKLLPLWSPILSCNTQLSGTLHMRLQNCRDCTTIVVNSNDEQDHPVAEKLLKWLGRLQLKMGQIEVQSSTATQFYTI